MIEIEKPRIECIENSAEASYGKFIVEPLERGYGTTLGNSLRRVLLSSLPGTAVTKIKIAGIQHEFSTIPGVTEDVTEIVLDVKRITPKLHTAPGTVKTVHIDAVGPSPPATSRRMRRLRSSIPSITSPRWARTARFPWS